MRKNINLLSYKLKIDKRIMENLKFKQCEGLFNWYFIHTEKSFVYKMKNGNIYACCKNIFANFFNPLIIIDLKKSSLDMLGSNLLSYWHYCLLFLL